MLIAQERLPQYHLQCETLQLFVYSCAQQLFTTPHLIESKTHWMGISEICYIQQKKICSDMKWIYDTIQISQTIVMRQ